MSHFLASYIRDTENISPQESFSGKRLIFHRAKGFPGFPAQRWPRGKSLSRISFQLTLCNELTDFTTTAEFLSLYFQLLTSWNLCG